MNKRFKILAGVVVAMGLWLPAAHADAIFTNFVTPAFVGQPNTTFQEWNGFTSATGTNTATSVTNPAGTPLAFDSTAATDGAFLAGPHIYSFSASTNPALTIPNFGNGGQWQTTVVLQIETEGSEIDLASVMLTPLGGSSVAPSLTTLLHHDISSTEFGDSSNDDYEFTWNIAGNAASYSLNLAADGSSMSWVGSRVDTVTTPVPEPASLGLLSGLAGLLLLRRRRVA